MQATKAVVMTLGLLAIAGLANYGAAQQPTYLVLKPTSLVEKDCETTKWKPSKNLYVSRAPYAYGYFGASASTKWSRSTNYHRSYTQWQRR
jgi:hypothetical protein